MLRKKKKKITPNKTEKNKKANKRFSLLKTVKAKQEQPLEQETFVNLSELSGEIEKEDKRKKKKLLVSVFSILFVLSAIYGFFNQVRSIEFVVPEETIFINETFKTDYKFVPKSAEIDELYFEFSNPELVEQLNNENEFKAISEGTVEVDVIYKNKVYDTKTITIKPILVEKISYNDLDLGIGRSIIIEPSFFPSDCTHKDITLESSDPLIVEAKNNEIISKSLGEVLITIKSVDGIEEKFKVNSFEIIPDKIDFTKLNDEYTVGDEEKLSIMYTPEDVTNKSVTFSSSNGNVAKVDQDGHVSIVGKGSTTIKATYSDDIFIEKEIRVYNPKISKIEISNPKESINVGSNYKINLKTDPITYDDELTWYSDNENVATVDENGNVKAIATGTVRITAKTSNEVKTSIKLDVNAPIISAGTGNSGTFSSINGTNEYKETYCLNTNSQVFHKSSCRDIKKMKDENKMWYKGTSSEIVAMGYKSCGHCNP